MYARVVLVHTKPERLDDFLAACGSDLIPALTETPGFNGGVVLSASPTNTAFIVSLWDSEIALRRAEDRSHKVEVSALMPCLVQDPEPEQFEVLVQAGQRSESLCARVITLPVPAEHIESALRIYREEYLPLLEAQPGFLGVTWLANRGRGTGRGISFWSSSEQMQAADQKGEFFPKVLARLAVYFSDRPEMGYYTVAVQM